MVPSSVAATIASPLDDKATPQTGPLIGTVLMHLLLLISQTLIVLSKDPVTNAFVLLCIATDVIQSP